MKYLENLFLWFVIYSIAGWIYETILCSVEHKRFVNRGFLNGPYCPIYGFGAVLDILILGDIQNPVLLFISGAFVTCTLEYITSWGMEKLFHARWWDYSERKYNINGRVCLIGAVVFGAFSVFLIKFLHPAVSFCTSMLPDNVRTAVSAVLLVGMLADTVYTLTKFSEFEKILRNTAERLDDAAQSVKALYTKANASYHGTLSKINSQVRRMLRSFPRLKSVRYNDSLKKLREHIMNYRNNG